MAARTSGSTLIDQHLLCDPKQQLAMASAEGKLKDESKDRQAMSRNANGAEGAEGAEGKMEEANPSTQQQRSKRSKWGGGGVVDTKLLFSIVFCSPTYQPSPTAGVS